MLIPVVYYVLELLKWMILIRVLLSWVVPPDSDNPLVEWLRSATDVVLRPISSVIPPLGGMDLSPIVAFFGIYLLQQVIVGAASPY